jgi:hypothetical protein
MVGEQHHLAASGKGQNPVELGRAEGAVGPEFDHDVRFQPAQVGQGLDDRETGGHLAASDRVDGHAGEERAKVGHPVDHDRVANRSDVTAPPCGPRCSRRGKRRLGLLGRLDRDLGRDG